MTDSILGIRAHTPGPWRSTLDVFGDYTIQPRHEELAIAAVVNGEVRRMGGLSGEHEANARLIAAAPELLAALLEVVKWNANRGDDDEILPPERQCEEIAFAMRAIAKAEGRVKHADADT